MKNKKISHFFLLSLIILTLHSSSLRAHIVSIKEKAVVCSQEKLDEMVLKDCHQTAALGYGGVFKSLVDLIVTLRQSNEFNGTDKSFYQLENEKIKALLVGEDNKKIDEYIKTDIEWFNNSLSPRELLVRPADASMNISKEVAALNVRGLLVSLYSYLTSFRKQTSLPQITKLHVKIYGKQLEVDALPLVEENAPYLINTIKALALKMEIETPSEIYLWDGGTSYAVHNGCILISKKDMVSCSDDEVEFALAHELAHIKTGTTSRDFDILQGLVMKVAERCPELVLDLRFLLMAIERMVDTVALDTTKNAEACIRFFQHDETNKRYVPKDGSSCYYELSTHPCTEERVGFGFSRLEKKQD